jgi:hypothetical protein
MNVRLSSTVQRENYIAVSRICQITICRTVSLLPRETIVSWQKIILEVATDRWWGNFLKTYI